MVYKIKVGFCTRLSLFHPIIASGSRAKDLNILKAPRLYPGLLALRITALATKLRDTPAEHMPRLKAFCVLWTIKTSWEVQKTFSMTSAIFWLYSSSIGKVAQLLQYRCNETKSDVTPYKRVMGPWKLFRNFSGAFQELFDLMNEL